MTHTQQAKQIVRLVSRGLSYELIAEELRVSPATVCRRFGPFRKATSKFNRRVTTEERQKIEGLLNGDEHTLRGIAKLAGRAASTILSIRNAMFEENSTEPQPEVSYRRTRKAGRCRCGYKVIVSPCPICTARGVNKHSA